MQRIPCGAKPLATPYLSEIQESPDAEYAVFLATVKCVAHAEAVEGSEQEAPAGVIDCSTVVAMDPAGRVLLLETRGAPASNDDWARRHFKNRSYQPPQGLESPKNALVAHLATLIGDERFFGWRIGYDLASLRLAVTSVMVFDLSTDPVMRNHLQKLIQAQGDLPQEVAHFIMKKPALLVPITMACGLLTSMKVTLRNAPVPERDVLRDAYFIAAMWRLLGSKIAEKRRSVETHLELLNAVYVGAGQPPERVLDARQTDPAAQRVALPQTTLRGEMHVRARGYDRSFNKLPTLYFSLPSDGQ